jgi:hypothetical protein
MNKDKRYYVLLVACIIGAGLLYLASAMTRGALHWILYLAIAGCIFGVWRALLRLGPSHF